MDLHRKYAPILHFNRDEQFFPMRLRDVMRYSAAYAKGEDKPVVREGDVTPETLIRVARSDTHFVRTVIDGPLFGTSVAEEWGDDVMELLYRWSATPITGLPEKAARTVYSWFSPKTKLATEKFWWNELVRHAADGSLQAAAENTLPRLVLPRIVPTNAADRYHNGGSRRPGYAYYYRELRDGQFHVLQYWFFYAFNDWGNRFGGMNDHEGDWEGMALYFRIGRNGQPQEPPAYIAYADHESRHTKPWTHPDVGRVGNHPVGYVGAGSHATYPQAGKQSLMAIYNLFDYATADGPTIDHDAWTYRINLDDVPWVESFGGSWGTRYWLDTRYLRTVTRAALGMLPVVSVLASGIPSEIALPGVSGPRGPLNPHREQVAQPVRWAGVDELEAAQHAK